MKNVEDIYPLSPMQQGMLFETLSAPSSGIYVEQLSCPISGSLDVAAFARAWQLVIERHPVLRTAFVWEKLEHPLQVVRQQIKLPYTWLDWSELDPPAQQERLRHHLETDRRTGFELVRAPLLRLALIRLDEGTHQFIWSYHHLLLDGWSEALIFKEVLACYEALRVGTDPQHHPPRPFRDYIAWLQEQDLTESEVFWRAALKGLDAPPLFLDCAGSSSTAQTNMGQVEQRVSLTAATTGALLDFARENQLTMGTILQGAWALLLGRYSGQRDVVFGTVVSGRPPELIGVEEMVGLFINTLPVRVQVPDEQLVSEWLKGLQGQQAAARAYEYSPLMRVQKWSGIGRGRPLFDTLFVFENYPLDAGLGMAGSSMTVRNFSRLFEKTNFPLTIAAVPGEELLLQVSYDGQRIAAETIERLLGHYQTLLSGMTAADRRVADVPLLTEPERAQLLVMGNDVTLPEEGARCIHELFEAQVAHTPEAIAVVCGEQQINYRDLNSRANQLARHLRSCGVAAETTVGTFFERSVNQVVALLGILKAGGAYLPIDPDCPPARSAFMIEDARAKLLLTQTSLRERLPARVPALVYLDTDREIASEATTNLQAQVQTDNLAYVIYTSGSTGRPKGALITHRSLVSSTRARLAWYHDPVSRFLLLSPFAFDSSLAGIFGTICRGGALIIPEEGQHRDANQLSSLIVGKQTSHLLCVPSLYSLLLETLPQTPPETIAPGVDCLRLVVVAGEPCPSQLVRRHHELFPQVSLCNEYGPTEATIWSSVHECLPQEPSARVPIGRPIANTQLFIMDAKLHLLPIGIAGELYIGGAHLARGYLGRSALTAERFIPNPFSTGGARLYKTGDRARYRADGEIEFLGRVDRQLKVRGYRIEPGEIEAILSAHPSVQACAMVAREDGPGATRLIAFVALDRGSAITPAELSGFLQEKLPSYMIPARFVLLDELPLTSSGKVDRARLLESDRPPSPKQRNFVAPRTLIEETLAALWAHALNVERLGIHDNFFELGGDSILAMQIIARARQAGLHFTPPQLFQYPTIAGLANLVGTEAVAQSEPEIVTGPVPLTPVQRWFFEQHSGHPNHYNQAALLETTSSLDANLLGQAVAHLLVHHDALRMRFEHTDPGWQQSGTVVVERDDIVSRIDLSTLAEPDRNDALQQEVARLQASLNLVSGPLIRVALFDLGATTPNRLLIAVHHLVVDGVSFRILIEDLETTYRQLKSSAVPSLPRKTLSFKRWATQLLAEAQLPETTRELAYWLTLPWPKVRPLPVDKDDSPISEGHAGTVHVSLSSEETRILLQEVVASYHTQINVVLLAAVAQAFGRWGKMPTLLLDLEGHGRESLGADLDLTRTVGWFTTIFPVLLELRANATAGEAVRAVKEQMHRLPRRGMGYGLLRYLAAEEIAARLLALPRAEVSFNYLGQLDQLFPPESLFAPARESSGPAHDPRGPRHYLVEINSFVLEGQLQLSWTYSESVYRAATVEALAAEFITALQAIIAQRQSAETQSYTPADFPLAELNQQQLARVIARVSSAKK